MLKGSQLASDNRAMGRLAACLFLCIQSPPANLVTSLYLKHAGCSPGRSVFPERIPSLTTMLPSGLCSYISFLQEGSADCSAYMAAAFTLHCFTRHWSSQHGGAGPVHYSNSGPDPVALCYFDHFIYLLSASLFSFRIHYSQLLVFASSAPAIPVPLHKTTSTISFHSESILWPWKFVEHRCRPGWKGWESVSAL